MLPATASNWPTSAFRDIPSLRLVAFLPPTPLYSNGALVNVPIEVAPTPVKLPTPVSM